MKTVVQCVVTLLALQLVGLHTPLAAEAFEGKLRMRTITADQSALASLVGTGAGAVDSEKVFALSAEQLTAKSVTGVEVTEMNFSVKGSRIRVDHPGQPHYAIMDGSEGVMYIVNPSEQSYFKQTKEDVAKMADRAAAMQAEMQKHLADMPPEQRKMMEQAMKRAGGGMGQMPGAAPPAPTTVRPTGKSRRINGMNATEYEAQTGNLTARAWLTKDRPDIDRVFKQFMELSKPMEKLTGTDQMSAQLAEKGMPLLVQTLQGDTYGINELVGIEEGSVDASLVQVPAGYTLNRVP